MATHDTTHHFRNVALTNVALTSPESAEKVCPQPVRIGYRGRSRAASSESEEKACPQPVRIRYRSPRLSSLQGRGGWPGLATGLILLGGLGLFALPGPAQANICDRTPQVLLAILDSLNSSNGDNDYPICSEVTTDDLNRVTELDLVSVGLSTLKDSDFANLSSLQYLYFRNNSLSSLDVDIFDDLANLRRLHLEGNALTSLDVDIFDDLTNLRRLYLDFNSLDSLDADIFDGLTNLRHLSLANNNLNSLAVDIFNDSSNLQRLYLDNNRLSSLPEGVFAGLTGLTTLTLVNNSLACLPSSSGVPWDRVADGDLTLDLLDCFGVNLSVTPAEVEEGNGGENITVTATLSAGPRQTSTATEVTISVTEDPTGEHTATQGTDFAPVDDFTITIPDRSESATGTFSLMAMADVVTEADNETVRVSGRSTVSSSPLLGTEVSGATITIQDVLAVSVCDRTLAVQTAILNKMLDIGNCEDVTVPHLNAVTGTLDLTSQGLGSLQGNDFAGLASLQKLDLGSNSLSSLPAGIFAGLASVQQLHLNGNSLGSLPEDVFSGLADLRQLFLNDNSLSNLDADIFAGPSLIWELQLSNNRLSSLPEGIFNDLTALRRLFLDDNSLSSLPDGIFNNLSDLEYFYLSSSSLACLPSSSGVPWDRVADGDLTLDLPDCFGVSLRVTPTEVEEDNGGESITVTAALRDGARLTSVDTEVTISVAEGTASEGADFTAVDDFTITIPDGSESATGTFTLTATADTVEESGGETVVVSGGSILSSSSVPGTEVSSATVTIKNVVLALVCQRTEAVQAAILAKIDRLDVEDCAEVTITHLNNITGTLDLGSKGLSILKKNDFAGLVNLQRLRLDDNDLDSLPAGIFDGLAALEWLLLGDNDLSSLPENIFAGLAALQRLSLNDNDLKSLHANIFAGLSSLQNLRLNNNNLRSLSADIFAGLTALEWLYLDYNKLRDLDADIFVKIPALGHLSLNNNFLGSLDADLFDGLSSLQSLYLNHNDLNSLPEDIFADLSSFSFLDLNNNDVSYLPENIFASFSASAGAIFLRQNGLVCLPRSIPWSKVASYDVYLDVRDLPDCFGVNLSVMPSSVAEGNGGESITVTAVLNTGERVKSEHTEVTISVAEGTASEGADFTAVDDFTITIPDGSESATGTFTLTAIADDEGETSDETVRLIGRSILSSSSVPGTDVGSATVAIKNVAPPGVSVQPPTLTVAEASSGVYTLALNTLPDRTVTITPASGDSGALTLSPASLTFTTSDWDMAQTVTVTAMQDDDANDETLTIRHSVSGYGAVSVGAVVTVSVTDHIAVPGVGVAPTTLTVGEGGSGIYTLALNTLPDRTVTITPTSSDSSALTLSPARLTFTPLNWSMARTVTVTAMEEENASDETLTIRHSVSGYGAVTSAPAVTVSVITFCERTPAVRDAILARINDITACEDVTVAHLNAIPGTLDLSSQGLSRLQESDFSGLVNLESLFLNDNDLRSLPGEIFNDLASVGRLYLNGNDLHRLPGDIFADLPSLAQLFLSSNDLGSLPADIFADLSNLYHLRLNENVLRSLSVDVFNNLPTLAQLFLSSNDLSSLPADIFADLPNLQELRLDDNALRSLPVGVFNDLTALVWLNLGDNDLNSLPGSIFTGLHNLQSLYLDKNNLNSLDAGIFTGLSSLETLFVSKNDLRDLDAGTFNGLYSLRSLYLENNSLSSLPEDLFDGLSNLQTLRLASNSLVCLPRSIPWGRVAGGALSLDVDWPDCFEVNLRVTPTSLQEGNDGESITVIAALSTGPRRRSEDTEVMVSVAGDTATEGTDFTAAPASFTITIPSGSESATGTFTLTATADAVAEPGGETVRLSGTSTVLFTGGAYMAPVNSATVSLKDVLLALVCGRTPAVRDTIVAAIDTITTCADATLTHLNNITGTLDLSSRNLKSLKWNDFAGLSKLESILLNDNDLWNLDANIFDDLFSLSNIHLQDNNLTDLPQNIFQDLPDLSLIYLDNNELETLHQNIFAGLSRLRFLHLNDNELRDLHQGIFAGLASLERLYLDDNALQGLPRNIFSDLVSLRYLRLYENGLSNLSAGVFAGLSSLDQLLLGHNSLPSLPAGIFESLVNLKDVHLQNSGLRSLPEGVFDGLASLQDLYLNNNELSSLPEGIFDGLSQLTVLGLIGNDLPCLQRGEVWSRVADGDLSLDVPDCFGVSLSVTPTEILEDNRGSRVVVGATLNDGERATPVDTQVSISVAGDTATEGVDFTPVDDITITIPSGRASATEAFILRATEDTEAEPGGETVRLRGTSIFSSSAIPGTEVRDVTATIKDNALAPICDRTPAVQTAILEEIDGITACEDVTLINLNRVSGILTLNSQGLSSLQENDLEHLSSLQWLLLNDNHLSTLPEGVFADLSSLVVLDLRNNALSNLPEGVFAGLSSLASLRLRDNGLECLPRSLPWGRVGDGDLTLDVELPDCFSVSLSVTPTEVEEGNGGESITVSAALRDGERAKQVDTQVSISVAGDTASEGTDFTAVEPFTITIPSGRESATATFTLTATADTEVEPGGETVLVSGASNLGAYAAEVDSTTVTIKDAPPGVSVQPTALRVIEGSSEVYTLVLNTLPTGTVTITPASGESGALTVSPARLIFTTANWNTAQTVRVTAVEDDDTNNATLTVSHGVSGYGEVTTAAAVTVSVTDDEAPPQVSLCDRTPAVQRAILGQIASVTSCEDATMVHLSKIEVLDLRSQRLSRLKEEDFDGLSNLRALLLHDNALSSLPENIFDGLANLQYLHLYNTTLITVPNNTLSVLPDDIFDGLSMLRQLYVRNNGLLCLPRSVPWGRVADGALTLDVDLPDCFGVNLSVTPRSVEEGNGGESITVSASLNDGPRAKPGEATQVSISVVGDTATEGADFTAVNTFTITIPAGRETATGTFTLNARWDTVEDDGETVVVSGTSILSASSVSGMEVSAATVTIRNVVPPDFSLSLTANQPQVNEGENVYFTITRARFDPLSTASLPATTIWVKIGYHNKILEPGVDLPAILRRVAFEEGQESVELLAVVTHDDELNDGDGMVRADLNLGAAASFYDVLQSKAWTRVVDDDVPEVTLLLLKERVIEGEDGYQFQIRRSCCSGQILNLSFGVEHRFFVNKDYLREDIYGPYQEIYHSNVNELHQGGSALRFEPGETVKFFRYYQPGFVGQYISGPLGGYLRLAIIAYPYDARLDEDPQEIPRYWNDTFDRRYSVSDTDYDKTLRIDNYAPGVSVETSQTSIVEGDEVEFTIKRFGGPHNLFSLISHNIRIEVEQIGDYLPASELGTRVIRMELGQTEYKLKIPTNNDSFYDPDGSVTVTLLEGAPTNLGEDTYDLPSEFNSLRQASVDITDNDGENNYIALSPTELQIPEGDSGTYTVMLTAPPEIGDINIEPFKFPGGDPDVDVVSNTLTFSADDWNIPQTVTITTEDDDDMDDDSAEIIHTVEFQTSESSLRVAATADEPSVQVSVLDDDLPRVSLSLSDDFISENGGVATVTATLSESLTTSTNLNVLVTPVAPVGSTDYQLSSNSILTFPAGETTAEGIVTITAVNNDVDAPDKVLRVRGEVTGGSNIPVNNELELVIQDDDSRGLTASTSALIIPEGHTATYTVVLDSEPIGEVTVTPSRSSGDTEITFPDALTFSVSNWNVPQTMTITAPEDGDDEDGVASIVHRTSGGDYDNLGQLGIVIINIPDNDTPGVTLSKTTLSIDEGSSETYTVVLNTQPTGDVIVTPSRGSGDEDVTISRALIFSSGNWNVPQTITVHAADDDDPNDDTATISHTVSGANYGAVTAASVQVSVTDSDPRGVTISETTLNIHEGSMATYTVVLNTLPSGNVTITPSRSDDSDTDVTVSDALTFSTANWNIPQTVTVRAAEDHDPNNDAATILHAVSGADYTVVIAASVDVIVTDNGTRGITLSDPTLNMNEGSTATYTVVLNTQPTDDVTVTPSRNDDGDTDVTVSNILTFSTGNWNTPQAVTVHAAEDHDPNNDTATILHAVSGADYDSVTAAPAVTLTVTDNDTRGITLSKTTLSFNEGSTGTYTVVLNTQPTGNVTVTPSRSDDSDTDVTVSGALTFSTGNWDTPQTVTINAAEDDDASNDMATINHTVSGADYTSVTVAPAVTVTVTDNDTRGVSISKSTLSVGEGSTGTYTVVLNTQPSGNVTITPSSGDSGAVSVSPASLTFTPSDWNTAQIVSVTGVLDGNVMDESVTISHAVAGADYGANSVTVDSVDVTVRDDDRPEVNIEYPGEYIYENETAVFTLTRTTEALNENLTVTLSVSEGDNIAATFPVGEHSISVNIPPLQDREVDNDRDLIVTINDGEGHELGSANSATVTVRDDDGLIIEIDFTEPYSLSGYEGDTVTPQLVMRTLKPGLTSEDVGRVFRRLFPSIHPPGTPPATSINVDVLSWPSSAISPDDYYGIVSETFTLSLADLSPVGDRLEMTIPLTPGVDLKQDNLDEPVEQFFFVLQAPAFSLAAYHGRYRIPDRRSPGGVTCPLGTGTLNCILVEIKDLPVLAVADLEGSEASGALEFSVTLNEEFPRDEVTVTYETSDETAVAGEDYASMTGTLRIPAGQTQGLIRIPLLDDDIVEESETFFLTLSSPASATLAQSQASGVILDDDTRGLLVTPTALTMREDGEDRYTVVLTSQPTQNVTITPANGDSGALSLSPSRLTFTAVTWNTPQTVGVRGVEDHDAANETVTISHSISGYDAPSLGAVVTVTVTDNDTRGVTLSEIALTFNEGGTATYTVVLHTQPTGDVTVTPSRTDGSDTDVTVSNALTFSTGNWNTPQTVTVNAAEDSDTSDDTATINHSISGADYASVTAASVQVTVTDNDTGDSTLSESNRNNNARGVTISDFSVSVNEGTTQTYTVVLNTQPTGDVTVTPSRSSSNRDVTVSDTLTFSTSNWDTPQIVIVSAAEDDDASNDDATIDNIVSGADYDSVTAASVDVIVIDDDIPGITISKTALTFNEGGTAAYTVVLHTQPTADVTVTPSRSDDSDTDVTVSNALTFSTGNWNTPQTVTVNAAEDDDASNDDATIDNIVSGADYDSVTAASVDVTVTDIDTRGVTISETALTFNEGGTATYTVVLHTQPTDDVTVTPSRTDGSDTDVTISNALTFSSGNWNTPQTVTVNAAEDNDASNDMATITHTVSGADYDSVAAASVQVTVTDNDNRGVTISETALTFNEGGTATYTVVLHTQPTDDVTVTPSRTDGSDTDVTISNALTFSSGNWNTPQTVTVNAAEDNDASNDMATITHTVSGADYDSVAAASVQVTVTDNDNRGVTISETALTFNEGGTATYTVVLHTQPTDDVTVTPSRTDGSDTDVTLSNALTFSSGNWNTPQTMTVNAAEDNDASNDAATITHTVSGADYGSVTAASVQVTVTDNDNRGVTVSETALTFNEGGTATYTVVLHTQPTDDVTVTPSRTDDSDTDVTVSNALTFSTGNWNTPQTVTINAAEDNDASNDAATITHTVSGADYDSVAAASVQVTVTDNDARGVTVSETALTFNEGGTATYTVVFHTQPTDDVTVTPSRTDDSDTDVTVSNALTFSTGNWNTPQTVTVNAAEDDDASNDAATIDNIVSGADYDSVTAASVDVTVTDIDTRGVTISETALTFNEGGTATYTVVLHTQPTDDVTVTPSRTDGSDTDVTISNALTFSSGNWNTPQTVTVNAAEDNDASNDMATITHTVSGADYGSVTAASVQVTVTDNDARGITVSETALTFNEGGIATYTVVLHTQPTDDVTVTPSRTDGSDTDVTISNALTFSTGNWNTPQTVTINAAEDNDASNDAATITHTVSGADYGSVTAASVQVTVTDNDNRGVTVSETALTFNEGGTATYTVVFHTQPTDDVIVTPSRTDGSDTDVTLSNALTFSSGNWNTPQTVTVNAAEDTDASNDAATITHTVSGADYGSVTAASVQVTVTDNDNRGVTVSETALTFNEGGTATYTVVLHTQPTDDVTVTPSRTDDSDTDVTLSNALTFSTGNWNTPQTVTVNAAEDDDASNDTATITHTVSGADYGSVTAASVVVTVTDNDNRGITISETALTFNEGGTATYTVVLHTQPTDDVTVTPSRTDGSDTDVTLSNALTFSTGNWNIPQTVTINAAEDNDASNDAATITHTVSGADYGSVTAALVQVTVTDNDNRSVTISETALTFNEGGTATYTVVLHTQPTDDVIVTPSRTDGSDTDVTLSNALTFSTGNWNIPQTVTINAAEDNDASNDAATITHTVSGADYDSVTAASIVVTVTDNDNCSITISETALTFNEGGTATYTVVLHTQPTGDVTVTPSRSDDSDTDVTVSGALTFSTGNWNTPQTVTVNAAEDSDTSNDAATINHAVSGADYDTVTAASVDVTVIDDDTPGITISETALSFNEGGTATYTVVLHTQPTGDVTVTPSRTDGSDTDVTVSNALTFSTGNWNIPQIVTVNAAEDDDPDHDMATITHTVSGTDYDSVTAASVDVTVTDNDNCSITISETALTFNEGGMATYTVVLHTQPTGDVTVTPSRSDDSDTDVTVSGALTFSTGNWNTPQTVTVNAAEDSDTSNDAATINHAVSGADYDTVTAASVDVTVIDDDTPGITISETALSFNEGGTATYTVVLHTQPTGDVTVTPSRTDDSDTDVTLSNALTFSTGNWNIPQIVTVNAAEDDDPDHDMATITHTVSGTDYDSVTAASVDVTVTDNDNCSITISETALTFNEGGMATYTVVLHTQPSGDVTVTPSRTDDSDTDVTVSGALTFSTGNWNTPQTVTVNAVEDSDTSNDAATINHAVSGADYDTVTAASVDVTVIDDDTPGITISEPTLTFNEGGTATYTVVLNTQPSGDVTVTPSRTDDSDTDVTVSNALTFSTGNWNTPQTVTVNAAEDSDTSNDAATINHVVSGADYDSVTAASVVVTVTDKDNRGITISEPTLTFNEGGTATYTVVLNTQPSGDVTVTPSRTDGSDTDVTVSNALTFSTGNWNTPQTVTVRAAEDDDPDHDTATITHDVSGADYDTITSTPVVAITVTDNDTRGVTISKKILNFDEGSTEIYTVVLNACSTGDVMVTPSKSSGDMDVTVSDTLTFSPSNWDTPQTVTVSAVEDSDASNDTATIAHAVSGADYGSIPAASVQVMVNDNGTVSTVLTLEASPEIVQEEDRTRMVTLTGTLNKAPWTTHMHVLVTVGAAGDGAIEGVDYSQVADLTLTIPAGETVGTTTFTLTLLDDSIDEYDETILVAGSSLQMEVIPTTITISNNDLIPQGWLSRFGRTVADQVLDAVAGRLEASRYTGIDVQLAGQQLGSSLTENDLQRLWSEKIREEDLLTNSSFTLTTGSEDTGFAGLWGQGAISHFRGREENLSLDGDVLSGMVGMDWTHGPTAAGLLLSHASGQGTFYSDVDAGTTAAATLTGLYPYAHHAFNEQMALWGVLGYGQGDYTLTQQHLPPIESNISLVMAALSGRNILVQPSVEDDFTIALKADLLAVQLSSEAVSGMFKGAEALVTRFRLGLEGSRQLQLENGNLLTPTFEIGVRRDGGDAEIGFGADIGMGLAWSNPTLGVASEIRGRALLTHAAAGFHEQGLALDFSYDPTPLSERGLSFSMGQSMGAAATGGMDALLSPATLVALDSPADVGQQEFEARLAYGFPILGDALYMTPSLGFTRSPQDRTYGLGLMFSPSDNHPQASDLEISLEGERREPTNADATPEHSLQLRFLFPLGGPH